MLNQELDRWIQEWNFQILNEIENKNFEIQLINRIAILTKEGVLE